MSARTGEQFLSGLRKTRRTVWLGDEQVGARILVTRVPFADEIAVYPGLPIPTGADAYALAFAIRSTPPA